jgi:succinate-semialdehyde dehydrogenase/glutarate-semialdehyde dehydrogenase
MVLVSINPSDGQQVHSYEEHDDERLRRLLLDAHGAFAEWRRSSWDTRSTALHRIAQELTARRDALAHLMAVEMGKPLAQGRAEIEKCASVCAYYAQHGPAHLADEAVPSDARRSFVSFRPLGTVLGVMPWNFPFWQVFRFVAPALMAGNAALLKHASNVTGCALAIEQVLHAAGLPPALFRALLVSSARVGALIDAPQVQAITLTGSTPAGQAVAARAGAALKKTVLELGGSDAYVVLADADLEAAAQACATARLINAGQSCIAAKRFVVVAEVRAHFEELLVEALRARRLGDPLDPATEVGPLARHDLRDTLHAQVAASVARGARVLLGGVPCPGAGAFYPPTVLSDVTPGMPAYDDELFGPVAAVIVAADEADALRKANDSPFGLGAAIFTADEAHGERLAREELEAGSCFVNTFVRSDPRLPFGGIKQSGYGRELGSFGIREFVNVKTVYVA